MQGSSCLCEMFCGNPLNSHDLLCSFCHHHRCLHITMSQSQTSQRATQGHQAPDSRDREPRSAAAGDARDQRGDANSSESRALRQSQLKVVLRHCFRKLSKCTHRCGCSYFTYQDLIAQHKHSQQAKAQERTVRYDAPVSYSVHSVRCGVFQKEGRFGSDGRRGPVISWDDADREDPCHTLAIHLGPRH